MRLPAQDADSGGPDSEEDPHVSTRHRAPRRPALVSVVLSAAVALVPLVVALAPPASAAVKDVRINEVESNGDTTDWIELANTGGAPVDLGGLVLRDNGATPGEQLVIPAGTTIPAGGHLAFDTDVATGGSTDFGLGGADEARLYAADGTTLLDSYAWSAHATTTYGRCPDGTGALITTVARSKAAANVCTVPDSAVRINEIESNGDATDWVELYNTGAGPVDISGWLVRDNGATPDEQARIPAGTSLAAGAYYSVDTDVTTGSTDFGLGGADQARLFAHDGTTLIDSFQWSAHATTTYGRCPNGTGEFATTTAATRDAANACPVPAGADDVVINEVRTNPNPDLVELRNVSDALVDVSSLWIADSATTTPVRLTAESTPLLPGGLFAFDPDAVPGGFGLNASDSITVYLADRTSVVDSYSWVGTNEHRTPSYGRCPGATGLVRNLVATPGEENLCEPIRLNEIESSGGTPGDWVELTNVTAAAVDVSGWVFKDGKDEDVYAIPAGTTVAPGGHLVLEQAQLGFGLGDGDAARLFKADGATLVDAYAWTPHAATTYGRCPDGLGAFATTRVPTKGAANDCPPPYGVDTVPWPGSQSVATSDPQDAFVSDVSKGDVSGLAFDQDEPGVLWAVKNKSRLFKLTKAGGLWTPVTTDGWAGGKALLFANGAGEPDTEGITVGPDGALYATSERDNVAGSVALNTVLRYDPDQPGPLTATAQWTLDADFPELDTIAGGSNLGFEGLTWVPDDHLVAGGFVDQSTSAAYDPADYAGHGGGLFLMALENDGALYAYALGAGLQHRVARIPTGFPHVMDVSFDPERRQVWAVCDDTCDGQTSQLELGATGAFEVVGGYDRPSGMPDLNNEGFAIAPRATCTDGVKEVVWADDAGTGGHSLRSGTLPCVGPVDNTAAPEITGTPRAGSVLTVSSGTWSVPGLTPAYQWSRDGVAIDGATAAAYTVVAADKGEQLTATVTVARAGYEDAAATSAPVTVEDLPLLVTAPVVAGQGRVGSPLTVSTGAWDESGLTYAYAWLRAGTPIAGATAASYAPTAADLAAGSVTARVTASRAGGASGAPATATPTRVLAGDAATAGVAPRVSGIPVTGQVLSGTPGSWSAPGLTLAHQWLRDGAPIAGATAASYTLVAADAGAEVALRVTAARAGYADGVATSAPVAVTGPTRAKVALSVRRTLVAGARSRASVRVTGAHDPGGRVVLTLRSGGRSVSVGARLADGRARLDLPRRLRPGTYRVVASYAGDELHRAATSATVTVKVVEKRRNRGERH